MAMTTQERLAAQSALGLNTPPVTLDVKIPRSPVAIPTDQQIVDQRVKRKEGSQATDEELTASYFRIDNTAYSIY